VLALVDDNQHLSSASNNETPIHYTWQQRACQSTITVHALQKKAHRNPSAQNNMRHSHAALSAQYMLHPLHGLRHSRVAMVTQF
jgi:hypothetical protein